MVEELGVQFYRFSISWPRILPDGLAHNISADGREYYNNLIDEVIVKGIEPVITMYHFDLPQRLQNLGGWTNPLIADWFADYARVLFKLYGNRVKTWITINEPVTICDINYSTYQLAPDVYDPDFGKFICAKNVLMAHARAWRIYDEEFRPKYHGKISYVDHFVWFEGMNEEDEPLADLVNLYGNARFSYPIFSKVGGWHPEVEDVIAKHSRELGYLRSALPRLTKEEVKFLRGTYDFYAMNHYTSRAVRKAKPGEHLEHFILGDCPEVGAKLEIKSDWVTTSKIFAVNPVGVRKALNWVNKMYGNVEIFITENGFFGDGEGLIDDEKISLIYKYLEQILLAVHNDGVNVTGYTYWSLMDNFEWLDSGYVSKFGLYHVNFSSTLRTRTARKSARYYRSLVLNRSLDVPLHPLGWDEEYARYMHKLNKGNILCVYLKYYLFLSFIVYYILSLI